MLASRLSFFKLCDGISLREDALGREYRLQYQRTKKSDLFRLIQLDSTHYDRFATYCPRGRV